MEFEEQPSYEVVTPKRQGERHYNSCMEGSSPSLDTGLSYRFESDLPQYIATWCKGNTDDFDSSITGSNPVVAAKYI